MNAIKIIVRTLFLFLAILALTPSNSVYAGTCQNCTVTVINNAGRSADITLEYSPSGSSVISGTLGAVKAGQNGHDSRTGR